MAALCSRVAILFLFVPIIRPTTSNTDELLGHGTVTCARGERQPWTTEATLPVWWVASRLRCLIRSKAKHAPRLVEFVSASAIPKGPKFPLRTRSHTPKDKHAKSVSPTPRLAGVPGRTTHLFLSSCCLRLASYSLTCVDRDAVTSTVHRSIC